MGTTVARTRARARIAKLASTSRHKVGGCREEFKSRATAWFARPESTVGQGRPAAHVRCTLCCPTPLPFALPFRLALTLCPTRCAPASNQAPPCELRLAATTLAHASVACGHTFGPRLCGLWPHLGPSPLCHTAMLTRTLLVATGSLRTSLRRRRKLCRHEPTARCRRRTGSPKLYQVDWRRHQLLRPNE